MKKGGTNLRGLAGGWLLLPVADFSGHGLACPATDFSGRGLAWLAARFGRSWPEATILVSPPLNGSNLKFVALSFLLISLISSCTIILRCDILLPLKKLCPQSLRRGQRVNEKMRVLFLHLVFVLPSKLGPSCSDLNHLIGECLKPPKDNNQRAFIGGSWSDNGEEDDEKAKDETCLVAQASNEGNEKKNLENDIEDETLEIDKVVNIKESRNHPLENLDQEVAVEDNQILTREITDIMKTWVDIIWENVFCLGGNLDYVPV
ncbi:hypothetical protein Tco_0488175 [Tanacetum coccineum]